MENQSNYYHFTSVTDPVIRKNICTDCKRAGLIPRLSRPSEFENHGDPRLMTEHAQLLHSAACGLSELSRHSSDEDEDELSYQNSFPSTLDTQYSPYDSQPDRTSSDSQQSTSSHHTYTMDSAGDVVKRLADLSKQDHLNGQLDSACSLSNSGELKYRVHECSVRLRFRVRKYPVIY